MASSTVEFDTERRRGPALVRLSRHGIVIRYTLFRHLVAIVDCCWFSVAGLTSHLFYHALYPEAYGFHSLSSALGIGLVTGIFYALLCRASGLYLIPSLIRAPGVALSALGYSLLALFLSIAMLFIVRAGLDVSRGTFLVFIPLTLLGVLVNRFAVERLTLSLLRNRTLVGPSVIAIGEKSELDHLCPKALMSEYGLNEIGRVVIDDRLYGNELEGLAAALTLSRVWGAEKFVVASSWQDLDKLALIRNGLQNSALPALLLPDTIVRRFRAEATGPGGPLPLQPIEIQLAPMNAFTLGSKRILDVCCSLIALVLLAPLMTIAAIAIKLDSRGPIIFRQKRHGFDRRPFTIFKFRSMHVQEDGARVVQARRGDSRVTRVGAFLRRTSIDELPQLFNVLKGQMSLVGPRPHALAHDNTYTSLIDRYCHRHHVKPGITGWAQINGARGQTQAVEKMKARVDLDLWYIAHCSLRLDLTILARTCFEVLKHEAY